MSCPLVHWEFAFNRQGKACNTGFCFIWLNLRASALVGTNDDQSPCADPLMSYFPFPQIFCIVHREGRKWSGEWHDAIVQGVGAIWARGTKWIRCCDQKSVQGYVVMDLENEVCPTDSLSFCLLTMWRGKDTFERKFEEYEYVSANCQRKM